MWSAEEIVHYWFGDLDSQGLPDREARERWFNSSRSFDKEIRRRFLTTLVLAAESGLEHWKDDSEGCLALILLFDQFSRHVFRQTSMAYDYDPLARSVCRQGLKKSMDVRLPEIQRAFFYMPLKHSELLKDQEEAVELYLQLAASCQQPLKDYIQGFARNAQEHCQTIRAFGRFPHRNKVLKRKSTEQEEHYLSQDNRQYGQ